jgi:hypothetical protein
MPRHGWISLIFAVISVASYAAHAEIWIGSGEVLDESSAGAYRSECTTAYFKREMIEQSSGRSEIILSLGFACEKRPDLVLESEIFLFELGKIKSRDGKMTFGEWNSTGFSFENLSDGIGLHEKGQFTDSTAHNLDLQVRITGNDSRSTFHALAPRF